MSFEDEQNAIEEMQQSAVDIWDSVLELLTDEQIQRLELLHLKDLENLGIL